MLLGWGGGGMTRSIFPGRLVCIMVEVFSVLTRDTWSAIGAKLIDKMGAMKSSIMSSCSSQAAVPPSTPRPKMRCGLDFGLVNF